MLALENKLEKVHSLSEFQYELFVPWSYDICLNVLKEFTNPHFKIFMLLSLMLILSLSGVEAALCRCITDVQLMCRFYFLLQISINSSTIMPVKEIAELVNSLVNL